MQVKNQGKSGNDVFQPLKFQEEIENYFKDMNNKQQIEHTFRKLSFSFHPDKHRNDPNATEKFQILSDERDKKIEKMSEGN